MATNTILIDCNQQQSVEAQSGNATSNAIWTNKVSEGLMLNPGDRVSVSSAFINEVGSGEDTIQFTETNNSATLTLQFYKCADAENCLILPRKWCYHVISGTPQQAGNDEVGSRPAHYATPPDVAPYRPLYRRQHDGKRYTIMRRHSLFPLQFVDHQTTVNLSIPPGYHSATNICELLTEQLHKSTAPAAYGESFTLSSPTFAPFVCATPTNFSSSKFDTDQKYNPYDFVGMLDPELYTTGFNLKLKFVMRSTTTSVTTLFAYTPANLQKFQDVFDAQAQRSDLIFGTDVSTANTRFLHVDAVKPGAHTTFGSDDDVSKATARLFVQYSDNYGWATNDGGYIQLQYAGDGVHAGITETNVNDPLADRRIGFDTHFSAYGVDAILLWNGYNATQWPNSVNVDRIYLGANNPSVSFDNNHARFVFSQLHTAREQINTGEAGKDAGEKQTFPLNPDHGKAIYQINPQYNQKNVSSRNFSFNPEVRLLVHDNTTPAANLLKLWTVFDTKSGIFVTDWGFTEAQWEGCFWHKMGFAYGDLNRTTINRQAQDGRSYPITTNADVNATQVMEWGVNEFGAPQQTLQLPVLPSAVMSTITIFADSTEIKASELARQQTDGYWLIRSSLIENSMFIDARGLSPVMAVVDKSYSASDYIYLGESSVDFMVTAQRTITDITTSLHLPDGSFAAVNDRNAVIYRIVKPNVAPVSILQSFLPQGQKKT